jgi:hypothetical protein
LDVEEEHDMGIIQDSLDLAKIAGKLANPELLERVTKLNEEVLELSAQNVELQRRVFALEKELEELSQKLTVVGETERRHGHVYLKGDTTPHCSRCFDVNRKMVHLVSTRLPQIGMNAICPECKTIYSPWPSGL